MAHIKTKFQIFYQSALASAKWGGATVLLSHPFPPMSALISENRGAWMASSTVRCNSQ